MSFHQMRISGNNLHAVRLAARRTLKGHGTPKREYNKPCPTWYDHRKWHAFLEKVVN